MRKKYTLHKKKSISTEVLKKLNNKEIKAKIISLKK